MYARYVSSAAAKASSSEANAAVGPGVGLGVGEHPNRVEAARVSAHTVRGRWGLRRVIRSR